MNLRHTCAADGCYMDTLWDWSPYNGVFADTGIHISDIDGLVERNGQFLVLDGKRPGRDGSRAMKNGQTRAYLAMARIGIHVIVMHGQPPATVTHVRQWRPGGEYVPEVPATLADVVDIVASWFAHVDREAAA